MFIIVILHHAPQIPEVRKNRRNLNPRHGVCNGYKKIQKKSPPPSYQLFLLNHFHSRVFIISAFIVFREDGKATVVGLLRLYGGAYTIKINSCQGHLSSALLGFGISVVF